MRKRRSFIVDSIPFRVSVIWMLYCGYSYALTTSDTFKCRRCSRCTLTRLHALAEAETPRSKPVDDENIHCSKSASKQLLQVGSKVSRRSYKSKILGWNREIRSSNKSQRGYETIDDSRTSSRWQTSLNVERKLHSALEWLQTQQRSTSDRVSSVSVSNLTDARENKTAGDFESDHFLNEIPSFPSVRECNSALAAFGDAGDLLRALRLYFKMRNASKLRQRQKMASMERPVTLSLSPAVVPTPNLVTYSTLMSRASSLGKPKVALRIWKIMRSQPDFSSSQNQHRENLHWKEFITPDVKAANILMNCHAKLGDIEAAEDLMQQMLSNQGGKDVPSMKPNLVTFNTLLDACHKTGELDKALYWKERLEESCAKDSFLRPDARTYTSLIATVARKAGQVSCGANDPSLAFQLLKEMKDRYGIKPNGMTYSALIDACGRCRRSDLALQALRLMLDDQKQQQEQSGGVKYPTGRLARETLESSSVGAWTSTINACGKAGRIDTAMKLFFESMPRFGVQPNTVTCGCLTDSLLRHERTTETLEVLRFMKSNGIALNQVMYTSLMTFASRLARKEQSLDRSDSKKVDSKAVQIYSELMSTVLRNNKNYERSSFGEHKPKQDRHSEELYQVSLLFREMKVAGVHPDLATYNVLLRSIANVGDVSRALLVLKEIQQNEDIHTDNRTWREILRAAGKAKRSDVLLQTWKIMVQERRETLEKQKDLKYVDESIFSQRGVLSDDVLLSFLKSLLICAWDVRESDKHTAFNLYNLVIKAYDAIISGSDFLGMGLINPDDAATNPHIMALFVQGVVNMESLLRFHNDVNEDPTKKLLECAKLRRLGIALSTENAMDPSTLPFSLEKDKHFLRALRTCYGWKEDLIV